MAGQGIVEHHPERIPVACRRRDRGDIALLGGHVGGRPHHDRSQVLAGVVQGRGQAEVEHHDPAVVGHANVLRLQIPMHSAMGVQGRDPLRQLPEGVAAV